MVADVAVNIHSGKGKKPQHYNTRMVEKEDSFGDRNPHTYVGTATGLGQGVDEELLLRDFADEDELMAMSQKAMIVEDTD